MFRHKVHARTTGDVLSEGLGRSMKETMASVKELNKFIKGKLKLLAFISEDTSRVIEQGDVNSSELSPNLDIRLTLRNILFNRNFPRNGDEARL